MLLSAVSVLVVAQSSSEIPERLMNNPVYVVRQLRVNPFKSRYSRLGSKIINLVHFLKGMLVAVPPSSQAACSIIKMEYIHLSTERGTQ